ncbi:ABC transporter substrate-binding protein [Bacillus sp. EB600]|uniref:ABC transporter substrate-binding protein n=1 Tax=Bacillus sp. EB600 TaxID=2806345 RepID=UPI00210D6822|nr:ABC transporter substrate-binding protein [Bacillus sp. EB600]MCQ6279529.1 ABC transporter substrate-binding protein [Bacillus sp. EB600]
MSFNRRIIVLCISIILVFTLAACNSKETSSTGGENAQGVTKDEILIGHIAPQTGSVAIYDVVRKGIQSYFNYVNENGGVNGRKLKLIAYDDQYQPAKTVQLAKRLVEKDKVFAMLANVCTPCNAAIKDYVVKTGVPMVLVGSGAKQFVNPPLKNYLGSDVMNYRIEAQVFLNYAINELGTKKIAIAYQNDDYGKEGLEEINQVIKNYPGVTIVSEVAFLATDTDFSSQAQKLEQAKPDAIINFASPTPAANLKKAMHKIGLDKPKYIVSSVGANDNKLFQLAGKDVWEGTYSGATYPMPQMVPNDPKMQLFVTRFSKDYPNDSPEGLSQIGWAAAQVMVESLKRTGDKLTWDNFLNSFNSFDHWEGSIYAGVTFSKDNHFGLTSMFMTQARDGKIVPITKPITFDPAKGKIQYNK